MKLQERFRFFLANAGYFARGLCPDCRTEDLAARLIAEYPGFQVEFQGDPRGPALYAVTPDGRKLAVW